MMKEILKDRKIRNRLLTVATITTPLFALLGGTPFVRFELNKINLFFPGILLIAVITILFWIINILLLSLSVKFRLLEKIFTRSLFSTVICLLVGAMVFYYFQKNFPPPQIRFNDPSQKNIPQSFQLKPDPNTAIFPKGNGSVMTAPSEMMKRPPKNAFFFPRMIHILTINIIILILCELTLLYFNKQRIELENEKLKQANLEARNDQLRMQLQPHFLFNSLNTLRLLLKKDPERAENYLLMLSDVLRFSTASANEPLVELEEELKFCITYLEMQKVRFSDMLNFSVINKELYTAEGKVPVFALQTLVENAIKHNAFSEENPLNIQIDYNSITGFITVKNKIQSKQMVGVTTKVGLKNLAERYKLMCDEDIIIKSENNEFAVSIKLIHPENNS
jgi:hypothetical protein